MTQVTTASATNVRGSAGTAAAIIGNWSEMHEVEWMNDSFRTQPVLERVRAEFLEMPGMKLTIEQVQRLCGVDGSLCRVVLDSLVEAKFLYIKSDGRYVRLTDSSPRRGQARADLDPRRFARSARRAS